MESESQVPVYNFLDTRRVPDPVHGGLQVQQGGHVAHAGRDQLGRQEHVGLQGGHLQSRAAQSGQVGPTHPQVPHHDRPRVLQEAQGQSDNRSTTYLSGE